MARIDRYTQAAAEQLQRYRAALISKNAPSGFMLAHSYRTWEIMMEQLRMEPATVLKYDEKGPEPKFGLTEAARWTIECRNRAALELDPQAISDPTSTKWAQRMAEYVEFGLKLVQHQGVRTHYTKDKANGIGYLIRENPAFRKIMAFIAAELVDWASSQRVTTVFLLMPAELGYYQFLTDRKDVVTLLREAQLLPLDVEHTVVDVPTEVEVAEFIIGMIPFVGNMVAVYEVYTGKNLFGYHLTDVERGVIAATLLLPAIGRLAKGGRALYTEARLAKLYGRDAVGWSRAVKAGATIAQDSQKLATLRKAEEAIRKGSRLNKSLADEAAKALDVVKPGGARAAVNSAVDQRVADALTALVGRSQVYASLDALALERVLLKGGNLNHIKGQLLEELLESRIVPWLRERWGSFSLGLKVPDGKQLEFIPGHLIRDLDNRQVTDGILGYRNDGVFNILGVFESKAGPHGARELSFTAAAATDAQKAELRAAARDEFADLLAQAKLDGKTPTKTVQQIEKSYKTSQLGGQIRRDIETLAEHGGIRIGGVETPISFSPTKTKFFGLVPAGLQPSLLATIRKQLEAEKVTFEMIAAELDTAELDAAARQLQPLAVAIVNGPVPALGQAPTP